MPTNKDNANSKTCNNLPDHKEPKETSKQLKAPFLTLSNVNVHGFTIRRRRKRQLYFICSLLKLTWTNQSATEYNNIFWTDVSHLWDLVVVVSWFRAACHLWRSNELWREISGHLFMLWLSEECGSCSRTMTLSTRCSIKEGFIYMKYWIILSSIYVTFVWFGSNYCLCELVWKSDEVIVLNSKGFTNVQHRC